MGSQNSKASKSSNITEAKSLNMANNTEAIKLPIIGEDYITMKKKHGTSETPVFQKDLRWE
jgi:hypothetical protein